MYLVLRLQEKEFAMISLKTWRPRELYEECRGTIKKPVSMLRIAWIRYARDLTKESLKRCLDVVSLTELRHCKIIRTSNQAKRFAARQLGLISVATSIPLLFLLNSLSCGVHDSDGCVRHSSCCDELAAGYCETSVATRDPRNSMHR